MDIMVVFQTMLKLFLLLILGFVLNVIFLMNIQIKKYQL